VGVLGGGVIEIHRKSFRTNSGRVVDKVGGKCVGGGWAVPAVSLCALREKTHRQKNKGAC